MIPVPIEPAARGLCWPPGPRAWAGSRACHLLPQPLGVVGPGDDLRLEIQPHRQALVGKAGSSVAMHTARLADLDGVTERPKGMPGESLRVRPYELAAQ